MTVLLEAKDVTKIFGGGAVIGGGPNQLPTVNGIPCTPERIGTCIGLIQSQG